MRASRTPLLKSIVLASLLLLTSVASVAEAAWNVTVLHPAGATSSQAWSVWGTNAGVTQYGRIDGTATMWNSAPNLTTPLGGGSVYDSDGTEQVGVSAGYAALWSGTPGSYVNLHPSSPSYPNDLGTSYALGVFAGLQTGNVLTSDPPGASSRAVLWSGSSTGWVDLHPSGAWSSESHGIYNAQEVGTVWDATHPTGGAGVWYSTNAFTSLQPPGAVESRGFAVYNGKQGGYVMFNDGVARASIWQNTVASWVSLHPAGASASSVSGVFGNDQVGDATVGGMIRAAYWNNTAGSYLDLHQFLPAGYINSSASDVWRSNAGNIYVSGWAANAGGQNEAMLWTFQVPEPSALSVLGALASLTLLRRRRSAV